MDDLVGKTVEKEQQEPSISNLHVIADQTASPTIEDLNSALTKARDALIDVQEKEGHWCFELEADCTISAGYILSNHFLDEIDDELEQKLAVYIREQQLEDGGWSLYYRGATDISCTVKSYYALKLVGDDPHAPHMQKARECIWKHGGAARSNVFARITLALFEQVPWRAVPFIPVEIMLLPKWFPFHLDKVSYWSRAVMVPLSIICSLKAKARNPRKVDVQELFVVPPEKEKNYFEVRSALNRFVLYIERISRLFEKYFPKKMRNKAMKKAEAWMIARLNGVDGLGAIFPAMAASYEAMALLGYSEDNPLRQQTKEAIRRLLVIKGNSAYCQPCVSPVWDTGLAALALQEEGSEKSLQATENALQWLIERQITDGPADWQVNHPDLAPGGWAFQYNNAYYPDLDDTAVVAWAMLQSKHHDKYAYAITTATNWLVGMQSKNGGFAAFDADNTHYYLNEIPFADHGALLDPPTADVSARCVTLFALLGRQQDKDVMNKCLEYLFNEQEKDGSWFGRWGTNYIYGTWSVLMALAAAGIDNNDPRVQMAVTWMKSKQQADGGWGESNDNYYDLKYFTSASTSFQTAWALLALLSVGEEHSDAVKRGVNFLLAKQEDSGLWQEPWYTAPGFPRVFYLLYHGYAKYFSIWALAKYRNAIDNN